MIVPPEFFTAPPLFAVIVLLVTCTTLPPSARIAPADVVAVFPLIVELTMFTVLPFVA